MAGHYIVCGMGHVGYRVATLLRRLGEPVVVVTQGAREDWIRSARGMGARVLIGDARSRDLLTQAGLQKAEVLIAATDKDLVNIEITLDARRIRPDLPVVVRLFDQRLAGQFETAFGIRRALAMATLAAPAFAAAAMGEQVAGSFALNGSLFVIGDLAVAPDSPLAGLTLGQAGERYHVAPLARRTAAGERTLAPTPGTKTEPGDQLTVLAHAHHWHQLPRAIAAARARQHRPWSRVIKRRLGAMRVWIDFTRDLWHNTPSPLRLTFLGLNALILLSILVFQRAMNVSPLDAVYFVLETVTTVGYGDFRMRTAPWPLKAFTCLLMLLGSASIAVLYAIITDFIVTMRVQQIMGQPPLPEEDHVIVVGLGNVGNQVVNEVQNTGACVVGVENNPQNEYVDALRAKTPVILGDGRLRETLSKAGIAGAHAVVAATSDDAVNLTVGLVAKEINPQVRTVLRLFDADFAGKVEASLAIDAAMSPQMIAAPMFVASALYEDAHDAFIANDRLFVILHRVVGEEWDGLTPARLLSGYRLYLLMRRPGAGGDYSMALGNAPLEKGEEILAMAWRQLEEM